MQSHGKKRKTDGSLESPWSTLYSSKLNFFRYLLRLRRYERKSVEVGVFRREWVWVTLSADFRGKGASPTNHCWCQKTRVIGVSCGMKISEVLHLVLSQYTRLTDRQTDRQTDGRTDGRIEFRQQYRALHYMQSHAKNRLGNITIEGHWKCKTKFRNGNARLKNTGTELKGQKLWIFLQSDATFFSLEFFINNYSLLPYSQDPHFHFSHFRVPTVGLRKIYSFFFTCSLPQLAHYLLVSCYCLIFALALLMKAGNFP